MNWCLVVWPKASKGQFQVTEGARLTNAPAVLEARTLWKDAWFLGGVRGSAAPSGDEEHIGMRPGITQRRARRRDACGAPAEGLVDLAFGRYFGVSGTNLVPSHQVGWNPPNL